LSPVQFDFRQGKSTVDAIAEVQKSVNAASNVPAYRKNLCALVSLDVANAFNSVSWKVIDRALIEKELPDYIVRIIRSYLSHRNLINGDNITTLSSGAPQGSVLGPMLWNIMYDGVLRLDTPEGVDIVGFANDVAGSTESLRTTVHIY